MKLKDIKNALETMNSKELDALIAEATKIKGNRQNRFEKLCKAVYYNLEALNREFPNAYIPLLVRGGANDCLDVMDYALNQNAPKEWEMRDYIPQ